MMTAKTTAEVQGIAMSDTLVREAVKSSEKIVSFAGTSQYSLQGLGTSACGLAALNFARVVFAKAQEGIEGKELLRTVLTKETAEEIVAICSAWSDNLHLEVDDIFQIPLFDKTLKHRGTKYGRPDLAQFHRLLGDLKAIRGPAVIIITRPPEIIACLKIPTTNDKDVFVIFDSHSRPEYPKGAGFIVNPSIDAAAARLVKLLPVVDFLDRDLQWQAQLLANYSGHVFVPSGLILNAASMTRIVMESSLALLSTRAHVAKLTFQHSNLVSENKRLEEEIEQMEERHRQERERLFHSASRPNASISISRAPEPAAGPSSNGHSLVSNSSSRPAHSHPSSSRAPKSFDEGFDVAVRLQSDFLQAEEQTYKKVLAQQRRDDNERAHLETQRLELSGSISPVPGPSSSTHRSTSKLSSRPTHNGPSSSRAPASSDDSSAAACLHAEWVQAEEQTYRRVVEQQRRYDEERARVEAQRLELVRNVEAEERTYQGVLEQQRRYDEEHALLEVQRLELAESVQRRFDCGVCFEEFPEDSVARLEPCGHEFCRGCVRDYVKAKIEEHRFPVLCPICAVGKGKAEPGVVTGTLVMEIGITEEQHKVWVEMELSAFSVMIHCRKCKSSMFVDKQDLEDTNTLVCPLPPCRYIWCKNCQQEITIGGPKHSCDGTSELDHLMKERGWKYCPSCRTPIQKVSGCNHMTCMSPGCNTHFCYVCGRMIVQSAVRNQIQDAVGAHYRACRLFEEIPDRAVPP